METPSGFAMRNDESQAGYSELPIFGACDGIDRDEYGDEGEGMGSSIESEELTTPGRSSIGSERDALPLASKDLQFMTPQTPSPLSSKPSGGKDSSEVELDCPICCMLFCEPVVTPCNHRFCLNCLSKVQHVQGHACPICRAQW